MEELIPVPLFRLPWMYHDMKERKCMDYVKQVCRYDEFEMTRKHRVEHTCLGMCRFLMAVVVFMVAMIFGIFGAKMYLRKADVDGYVRVSIQHPVDGCNPLDPDCAGAWMPKERLRYCNGSMANMTEKVVKCKYLDEFEIFEFDDDITGGSYLIPTRISVFEHARNPACNLDPNCQEPFQVVSEENFYVADIEDYTLLFDHSYVCPNCENHLQSGSAWKTPGLFSTCPVAGMMEKEEEVLAGSQVSVKQTHWSEKWFPSLSLPWSDDQEGCHSYLVSSKQSTQNDEIMQQYNAWNTSNRIRSITVGDIVRVGDLLSIAGIQLDKVHDAQLRHVAGPVRYEGEALMVQIRYVNWRKWTSPNALPVIYSYEFFRMPAETYKAMHIVDLPNGNRRVLDVHGIFIKTQVEGSIGSFNWHWCTVMIIEAVALTGVAGWIVTCISFNKAGIPELHKKVHKELPIHLHVLDNHEGEISSSIVGHQKMELLDHDDE